MEQYDYIFLPMNIITDEVIGDYGLYYMEK